MVVWSFDSVLWSGMVSLPKVLTGKGSGRDVMGGSGAWGRSVRVQSLGKDMEKTYGWDVGIASGLEG